MYSVTHQHFDLSLEVFGSNGFGCCIDGAQAALIGRRVVGA